MYIRIIRDYDMKTEITPAEVEIKNRLEFGDKICIEPIDWKYGIKYRWYSDNAPVDRVTFWSTVVRIKGVGHNAPEYFKK